MNIIKRFFKSKILRLVVLAIFLGGLTGAGITLYHLYDIAKNLPDWLRGEPCPKLTKFTKLCHVEKFSYNVPAFAANGVLRAEPVYVLFDYSVSPVRYQYFEGGEE